MVAVTPFLQIFQVGDVHHIGPQTVLHERLVHPSAVCTLRLPLREPAVCLHFRMQLAEDVHHADSRKELLSEF